MDGPDGYRCPRCDAYRAPADVMARAQDRAFLSPLFDLIEDLADDPERGTAVAVYLASYCLRCYPEALRELSALGETRKAILDSGASTEEADLVMLAKIKRGQRPTD